MVLQQVVLLVMATHDVSYMEAYSLIAYGAISRSDTTLEYLESLKKLFD